MGKKSQNDLSRKIVPPLLRMPHDPSVLFVFFLKGAVHYHHYLMAEQMTQGKTPPLNPF